MRRLPPEIVYTVAEFCSLQDLVTMVEGVAWKKLHDNRLFHTVLRSTLSLCMKNIVTKKSQPFLVIRMLIANHLANPRMIDLLTFERHAKKWVCFLAEIYDLETELEKYSATMIYSTINKRYRLSYWH